MNDGITRKYFGSPDDHISTKSVGSAFVVPECKAFVELDNGEIVEEAALEQAKALLEITTTLTQLVRLDLDT